MKETEVPESPEVHTNKSNRDNFKGASSQLSLHLSLLT